LRIAFDKDYRIAIEKIEIKEKLFLFNTQVKDMRDLVKGDISNEMLLLLLQLVLQSNYIHLS
jgi:hypothetical protein